MKAATSPPAAPTTPGVIGHLEPAWLTGQDPKENMGWRRSLGANVDPLSLSLALALALALRDIVNCVPRMDFREKYSGEGAYADITKDHRDRFDQRFINSLLTHGVGIGDFPIILVLDQHGGGVDAVRVGTPGHKDIVTRNRSHLGDPIGCRAAHHY